MTALRELAFDDLFKFNRIIFDPLTEVYSISFFVSRLIEFPMLAKVAVAPNEQLMGFAMGTRIINEDVVGDGNDSRVMGSHGHVSVVSIDSDFRRLGLGTLLMDGLKAKMEVDGDWYVDLFVRCKNQNAIKFYELLGYVKYCFLSKYYVDDYGYEMRLPLSQDVEGVCLKRKVNVIEGFYSAGQEMLQLVRVVMDRLKNAIMNML